MVNTQFIILTTCTVELNICTLLCSRSLELFYLAKLKLYPLSSFPLPLDPGNHHCTFLIYRNF